jgi:hypothetical protein
MSSFQSNLFNKNGEEPIGPIPRRCHSNDGVIPPQGDAFSSVTKHFSKLSISPKLKLYSTGEESSYDGDDKEKAQVFTFRVENMLDNNNLPMNSQSSTKSASPFLGEDLSVHVKQPKNFSLMTRSVSFDNDRCMQAMYSRSPIMMPMPLLGTNKTRTSAVIDALKNVPLYSWIMPYIIACASNDQLEFLSTLKPIIKSSQFSDQYHANSSSKSSTYFSNIPRPLSVSPPCPAMPLFMQSSWQLLGLLWVCKDPTWRPWEQRLVFLCVRIFVLLLVISSYISINVMYAYIYIHLLIIIYSLFPFEGQLFI